MISLKLLNGLIGSVRSASIVLIFLFSVVEGSSAQESVAITLDVLEGKWEPCRFQPVGQNPLGQR